MSGRWSIYFTSRFVVENDTENDDFPQEKGHTAIIHGKCPFWGLESMTCTECLVISEMQKLEDKFFGA